MRILIHGINFSPELTGIGKYSGEMAEWLAAQGHEVRVVTAPPYYPQWRVAEGYSGAGYKREFVTASPSTSSGQAKAQQSSDLAPAAADGFGWIATSAMPPRNDLNDGMGVIASEARRSSGSKRHLTKGMLDRSTWIATSAMPPDGTTGKTTSHLTKLQAAQQSRDLAPAAGDGSGWIATSAMPPDGTTSHSTKLQTAQQSSDLAPAAADGSGWIATSAMPPRNDGMGVITSHSTDETTSQSTKPPKYGGKVAGYKAASWQVAGYRNDGMGVIASAARRSSGSKRHLTKGILDRSTWIATSAMPPDKTTSHLTKLQTAQQSRDLAPAAADGSGWIATSAMPPRNDLNDGMVVYRCPLWVPAKPSGLKRLLHLASFALSSFPLMLWQIFWRPDVVLVIEPPLMSAPAALLVARLSGARAWLHVQDFEVDAAFDLGILQSRRLRSWVLNIEQWLMRRFCRVSTISPRMLEKLLDKGVSSGKAMLFPNWVDTGVIFPLDAASPMRAELGIAQNKTIALYSGNMGEKQGLEIVLEAASGLANRDDIQFVLCGAGAARVRLQDKYGSLPNVMWLSLQPVERLNDLLNMADIHLLPQRADAADLVMPSRLTGMLASGRPVVATAHPGTQVAEVVQHCGVVVTPGDADKLAQAVMQLADDETTRSALGKKARAYAAANLERNVVLAKFEADLLACVR